MTRWLERIAIVVTAIALAIGVIVLLSGGLAGGRDDPGVAIGTGSGPGTAYPDQGNARLRPGDTRPLYDSEPPTSGAHYPVAVTRNDATITDDQLLQALSLGNIVFLYGTAHPAPGLQALADAIAPHFTPELAAHGQTIILARRPGLAQITALAWTHSLTTDDAGQLRAFAQHWLGRGTGTQVRTVVGNE